MDMRDFTDGFYDSLFQEPTTEPVSKPVSEERREVIGTPVDHRSLILGEAEKDVLNPEVDTEATLNSAVSATSSVDGMDGDEKEAVNFVYQNSDPGAIWSRIKNQTHSYMVVQETVDLAIADLAANYSTAEKVQDFITGVAPFETIEDNFDMVNSVFKGDNLGKLHRKFHSGSDEDKAAVITYITGLSEYMEKSKVLEMLSLLRDPNGAEELDSFWGVQGGGWAGLELLDLIPLVAPARGAIVGGAKAGKDFIARGWAKQIAETPEQASAQVKIEKQLNGLSKLVKDKLVKSRPADKLADINPQKAKEVIANVASGNTVSKTMSQTEAVLKLDPTAPDGMYKAGATLPLYDETLSVRDKASWAVDQIISGQYFLRERLFDDKALAKAANDTPEQLEKAKKQLEDALIANPKVELFGFSQLDASIGGRLSLLLGEERYSKLKASLDTGEDLNLSRSFLSNAARDAEVRLVKQEEVSPTEVKFTYELKTSKPSGRGTVASVITKEEVFTIDDITSELGDQKVGLVRGFFSDPVTKYNGNAREIAKEMLRIENVDSKLSGTFRKLFADALKPIGVTFVKKANKEKLIRVGTVLEKLDDLSSSKVLSRVPTSEELSSGFIRLEDGTMSDLQIRLGVDEQKAFYNTRDVLDQLARLGESEEIRRAIAKGYHGVSNNSLTGGGMAKLHQLNPDDLKSYSVIGDNLVYLPHSNMNTLFKMRPEDIDDLLLKGYRLVEFAEPKALPGKKKELYTLAFVPKDELENLASYAVKVRGYRINYLPRVYDSAYWVKTTVKQFVNGKTTERMVAVMQTNSRVEADDFIAAQKNPSKFSVLEDREAVASGLSSPTGGASMLFSRSRADKPIAYGKDLARADRVGAFDSLARYVSNLSGFVGRNEMRLRVEQQWLKEMRIADPANNTRSYATATLPVGHSRHKELMDMRKQIDEWMRLPTAEEKWWSNTMQSVYEWSLGKEKSRDRVVKNLASTVITPLSAWLKKGDPLGYILNTNFNLYLGMFNPAQMFVQAQQSAVTAALHGEKWVGAMGKQFILSTLDHAARGGGNAKKLYPHLRKVFNTKMTDEQIDQMWNAWNKSGLFDSVVNTADYAAMQSGKNLTGAGLTNLAEKGQVFYRGGVLSEKRINFIVAYEEWINKFPNKVLDNSALRSILRRTNEFSFEMGKANRAQWQKGVLSIPTQFYQIFAKMVSNMAPAIGLKGSGNFTQGEALRIFFGISAIYGAAGTPIGSSLLRMYKEITKSDAPKLEEDPGFIEETAEAFVTNGIAGAAVLWMSILTGDSQQYAVGQRFSPLSGMDRVVDEALFEKSFMATAAGASGGIFERFSEMWGVVKNITHAALATHEFPSMADYIRTLDSALSVASSFRNSSKAFRAWYFDEVRSTAGVLQQSDATVFESLMMSLGITSSDLMTVYHADEVKRFQQERSREYVREMRKIFLFYTRTYDIRNEEKRGEMVARMAAILRSIPSESKKAELMMTVWNSAVDMSKEDKQHFDGIRSQIRGEIEQGILGAAANSKLGVGE